MTHIERPILEHDKYREQTEDEAIETFHLAAKELRTKLPPVAFLQEVMKIVPISEIREQLSKLRSGKF